ncbi:MAG: prolipoprotein diacylglyceryl transferase [Phycisphaeraceae bacterium]|nr:prolipoprotein diacylglyceryl transferase [Phycisphaerales bacterium]MCB9861230.1 prolipoprotein diacylglyceryl transferase [Phycisphaeraceae bacterium]
MNTITVTLADWVHNLDPVILPISGRLAVRWYGLSYALGFFVAWLFMRWLSKRGACAVPAARTADAILLTAIITVVGGRLGYVLFYQPGLLNDFSSSFPFWGVFDTTQGGMASHGGIIGAIVGAWLVSRGWKVSDNEGNISRAGACPLRHVLDTFALLCPFGLFFGRLANFVNGELLGRVVAGPGESAPWWAVRFPQEFSERFKELSEDQQVAMLQFGQQFAQGNESPGIGYERAVSMLHEGVPGMAEKFAQILNARHPSQLYQALAEGVVLATVLWIIARKPRLPGIIGCWFMITYGVLRVVTEFWRLPDSHLVTQRIAGLSRGQWLSVLMVGIGIAFLLRWRHSGEPKMGGWAYSRADTTPNEAITTP